jgi:hypothetical protein
MAPYSLIACPLAAIGISGIFSFWTRLRHQQVVHERVVRDRVTYMLWTAANRI